MIEHSKQIEKKNIEDILSLTPMQEGMLFYYLKDTASDYYFEQLVLILAGEIKPDRFKKAWDNVVQANESLRTFFRWEKLEKPVQVIWKHYQPTLIFFDLSLFPGDTEKQDRFEKIKLEDRQKKFDLREVPFRVILCKFTEAEYGMIVSNHHILYDGWSTGIILKEFFHAYTMLAQGITTPAQSVKPPFGEIIRWYQNQDRENHKNFWKNYLCGFESQTLLPSKSKSIKPDSEGAIIKTLSFVLEKEIKANLEDFLIEKRVTSAAFFYCVWGLLLQKYCNSHDVVFGTTVAGRSAPINGMENMVGLFINTIPLRITTEPGEKVINLLARINDFLPIREAYESTSLVDIKGYSELQNNRELFDSLLVLENYPLDPSLMQENSQLALAVQSYSIMETTSYPLTVSISAGEIIDIHFTFDLGLFEQSALSRLMSHFNVILEGILENYETRLNCIELLTEEEKQQILVDFNNTSIDYPRDKTLPQFFKEQVERAPDHIALAGPTVAKQEMKRSNTAITYSELNTRSDQLTHHLIGKGIVPGTILGIMIDRSIEMIISILGIVKAGGAYLPIDEEYPKKRIRYMLMDANVNILIRNSKEDISSNIEKYINTIFIDDLIGKNLPQKTFSHLHHLLEPVSLLAYIIYTSGSTGKPKGVMVENGNIVRLVKNSNFIDISVDDRLLLTGNIVFDITTFEIWSPLLNGASLYLVPQETILERRKLENALKRNRINILHLVPQVFIQLVMNHNRKDIFADLDYFLIGGDLVRPVHINELRRTYKKLKILHMYGPTENTTFSTFYPVDRDFKVRIPIGKPLSNSYAYVMGQGNQLQPIGVPGELFVGGRGIARGYLNKPELTLEKFIHWSIKDNHSTRFYKTGDIAKWLGDGNIEFFGRIDHQVKIRGIRIEPGEIENQLLRHEKIKEAIVLAKTNSGGDNYLCAYIVSKSISVGKGDEVKKIDISELREFLSGLIPINIIPSYFIQLDYIPLNANGKVDRKALPEPEIKSIPQYVEPASEVENILAEIWSQVLGNRRMGINDNFFEVGGDSIKAIQITSKMYSSGYKVTLRDIFKFPVISELASVVVKLDSIADQSVLSGHVPLTPLQKLFFQENGDKPNHFNQAVMFYSEKGYKEDAIKAIFIKIQEHHDALRMSYKRENNRIIQNMHHLDYPFSLSVYDLKGQKSAALILKNKAEEIQAGINIETGPLMKLAIFHMDDGDRLLIVIHHLVTDGVSWRILFDDFGTLYKQYEQGELLKLPAKTDSFKLWSETMAKFSTSGKVLNQLSFWKDMETKKISWIKSDFEVTDKRMKDLQILSFNLAPEETGCLLTRVNHAFSTEINDILITALGTAIKKSFGIENLAILFEGHGREDISESIDVSRTIGWFTSFYPLILDFSYTHDIARQIKEVKETLRRVPGKGVGYGILKFLTPRRLKQGLEFNLIPQVTFNYLGQFDTDIKHLSFRLAEESVGNTKGENIKMGFDLEISGVIINDRLKITILFNKKQYKTETIQELLDVFQTELLSIILYCVGREKRVLTPSDLTYKHLSIETLEQLQEHYNLVDIYPLVPMQEGILFHSLWEKRDPIYLGQFSYHLQGKLEVALVEKSQRELFNRHDVLRTVFIYNGLDHPLQVVLANQPADIHFEDLRHLNSMKARCLYIEEFKEKDRLRSFDLAKEVLFRLALFQVDNTRYQFVWSFHHIILDGWSIGVLNREFFEIYDSYVENRKNHLSPSRPFQVYIQWLEKQDENESQRYWRQYLESYEQLTSIPKKPVLAVPGKYRKKEELTLVLTEEKTNGLKIIAERLNITLNTVFQTLWGIILSKYSGQWEVVFGSVVSGRPTEIKEVESMVGCFINTVPVRIGCEEEISFSNLVKKVQQEAIISTLYHYYPLPKIYAETPLKQNLFDHILAFENYPVAEKIDETVKKKDEEGDRPVFSISKVEAFDQDNFDLDILVIPGKQVSVIFMYNGNVYDGDTLKKVSGHMEEVIDAIIEKPDLKIKDIDIKHHLITIRTDLFHHVEDDFVF